MTLYHPRSALRASAGVGGAPASSPELDVLDCWINPNRESAKVGTVSVRLRKFVYSPCSVTRTKYGFYVHLPSIPLVDGQGHVLKDERGKWKYRPAVSAIDKEAANAFSKAVLAIIRQRWPEMLEGGP
jgi:hypothetical protein